MATITFPALTDDEKSIGMLYPQAQLEAAFDLVKPAGHWKDRIDATVPHDAVRAIGGQVVVEAAIAHFTGTTVDLVESDGPELRFVAPGYWAGPCN